MVRYHFDGRATLSPYTAYYYSAKILNMYLLFVLELSDHRYKTQRWDWKRVAIRVTFVCLLVTRLCCTDKRQFLYVHVA